MRTTISIIIPAYNVEKFIGEALASVLQQTRPADEIIVIDDCSTDDTAKIVNRYAQFGVRLLRTPVNSGSALARNIGIEAASGEFVAMLDADDVWLPEHLEVVGGRLEAYAQAAVAFSQVQRFGAEDALWAADLGTLEPVDCFFACAAECFFPHNTVIARRDHVVAVGGYRPHFRQAQDFDLFLRLSYRFPFLCVPQVTAQYRRHPESVTKRSPHRNRAYELLSRHLFLEEFGPALSADESRHFKAIALRRWSQLLDMAWHEGNYEAFSCLLDLQHLVPDSAEEYARWSFRDPLFQVHKAWQKLPASWRHGIRWSLQQAGTRFSLPLVPKVFSAEQSLGAA